MAIIGSLVGFGLRQVLPESAGSVVETVERWFRDHSQTLPKALERAHDRAWQSLGVALAGNGFLDRVKLFFASGDDKGIREQVQRFLKDNVFSYDGTPDGFRQACLDDLKRLRKSGLLSLQRDSSGEIARQTAGFTRHADPQALVEEAQKAVSGVADVLVEGYPNLSRLIRRPTPAGPPLLAAAFCYFFRREVETDGELAHGLFFDGLRQLSASQAKGFGEVNKALVTLGVQFDALFEQLGRIESAVVETHGAVLDLQVELQRLGGLHLANAEEVQTLLVQVLQRLGQVGMQRGEVRPQYSFSIRSEDERQAIRALLARFRRLSANEQQQVPALLNGLGMLQVGAGDFEQARQTFAEVAERVTDPASKAEASFNAYRSALEQKRWDEALESVLQAARLAPGRFAPFPLQRYLPQRILGAGGFGTVFLCQDAYFRNREVAIKALHDATLDRSLGDVFGEAHALTELNHPCLIGVLDCSYADLERQARPFLVMPYFPGISLETYVREHGPLGVEELLAVALQVAQGMQAAHERHVLHRDLKPENILVRREGGGWQVKIIDFGLALRRRPVETPGTRAAQEDTVLGRSVAGTLQYAPPEQMGRLPGVSVGPYSDVYAFGKTCCYALFQTTEPKRRHWAAIHEKLAEMLEKCTEQELKQRHPSFGPVLRVLEAFAKAFQEREQHREERRRAEVEKQRHQQQEETERQLREKAEAERQRLEQQRDEELRQQAEAERQWVEEQCHQVQEQCQREEAERRQVVERSRQRRVEEQRQLEEQEGRDEAAWQVALQQNTAEAYREYLATWPQGQHVAEVSQRAATVLPAARHKNLLLLILQWTAYGLLRIALIPLGLSLFLNFWVAAKAGIWIRTVAPDIDGMPMPLKLALGGGIGMVVAGLWMLLVFPTVRLLNMVSPVKVQDSPEAWGLVQMVLLFLIGYGIPASIGIIDPRLDPLVGAVVGFMAFVLLGGVFAGIEKLKEFWD